MSDFSSIGPGINGSVPSVNRLNANAISSPTVSINRLVEPAASTAALNGSDRVELSSLARYLDHLRQLPAVRQDLIAQVKQAIKEGTYEIDEKIDLAIERLAEEEL